MKPVVNLVISHPQAAVAMAVRQIMHDIYVNRAGVMKRNIPAIQNLVVLAKGDKASMVAHQNYHLAAAKKVGSLAPPPILSVNSEAAGEPWIAQCSFPRPHQVAALPKFWDLYDTDTLSLPPGCDAELHGKAPHFMKQREVWRNANWPLFEPNNFDAARRRKLHAYYGAISQVDAAVGELLHTLDELNIADNTVVIYTSDHGDYACQFDIMEKSPGICADAITRIPFIWRGPQIQAGVVNQQHVESVDLSQTICDWAGVDPLATSDEYPAYGPY